MPHDTMSNNPPIGVKNPIDLKSKPVNSFVPIRRWSQRIRLHQQQLVVTSLTLIWQ